MKKEEQYGAIVFTALAVILIGYFSIEIQSEYGYLIFIFLPFLTGFLPTYIIGRKIDLKKKGASKPWLTTLFITIFALFIFAIEGMICVTMSLPFLFLFSWIGSVIALEFNSKKYSSTRNTMIILSLFGFSLAGVDQYREPTKFIPVKTEIEVNAPIKTVWNHVVTFDQIDSPKDWLFKTGIAYPTDATIKGQGVGAIRYCNFSTGSFVEPITTWNEPNLLQFGVDKQPPPMNEFNPFWDIHPKHLDGYFISKKGQFKLKKKGNHKTVLEGTTWYEIKIGPEFYWKLWSDFIIHRIHKRVLGHIKVESEKV